MTNLEIERRFLLKDTPNHKYIDEAERYRIHQFYLKPTHEIEGVIRYRMTCSLAVSKVGIERRYEKIIKTKIEKGVNKESDIKIISEKEFEEAQKSAIKVIYKVREVYSYNGLKFEVDDFKNPKLVICEVELKQIDQEIIFPDFIKELILLEITGMDQFSNYNLANKLNGNGSF